MESVEKTRSLCGPSNGHPAGTCLPPHRAKKKCSYNRKGDSYTSSKHTRSAEGVQLTVEISIEPVLFSGVEHFGGSAEYWERF